MKSKKKYLGLILISFSINLYAQINEKCRVIDIDSTSKNYLISVKSLNHNYIIVSPMIKIESNHKKLVIGKEYDFLLLENSLQNITEPEISSTLSIDEKVIWRKGDDFDVVFCNDLKGLYYIRKHSNERD